MNSEKIKWHGSVHFIIKLSANYILPRHNIINTCLCIQLIHMCMYQLQLSSTYIATLTHSVELENGVICCTSG